MTVFEFSGQPRPQTQPPGPGGMPSGGAGGGGQSGDLQAQWAEYYRQLGYFYGQQPQGGGGGNQPTGPPGEQKVGVESLEKHGTIVQEIIMSMQTFYVILENKKKLIAHYTQLKL